MVVLVDLDDEPPSDASHAPGVPDFTDLMRNVKPVHHSLAPAAVEGEDGASVAEERHNPNINGFSAALSCYPIVRQLAGQLDLNTMHDLSRTCRQFRANLLEYRQQLKKHTLHCYNEQNDMGTKLGARLREARVQFLSSRQLTSGRVGKCARDMVGECQRCGTVVCRNCTMKPPPTPSLRARHRRLCRTCNKVPLPLLMSSFTPRKSSPDASSPSKSPLPQRIRLEGDFPTLRAFTAPAFERTPCNCDNVVWLCAPCGKDLRNADTMYVRAWTWRTQYSNYLGGVGTGVGEGNEGVECGRGATCLGAKIVEHETCEPEILDGVGNAHRFCETSERWRGTSYHAQEIEGIGGVMKVKHKKQVRVGECVKLYEDEREKKVQYLEREVNGNLRSWCSWCERIVLGDKDKTGTVGETPASSGSSSASSSKSN